MAMTELGFSARAYTRILKVARTIADLDASETVRVEHVSEATLGRLVYYVRAGPATERLEVSRGGRALEWRFLLSTEGAAAAGCGSFPDG